jgi:hypothetical protein
LPGNWLKKDLSNIENNPQSLSELIKKRKMYFIGITNPIEIKLNEVTTEDCYNKGKDSTLFFGISFLISQDYDVAKMFGFALEDRNIPEAKEYQYGLFAKYKSGEEQLVKTFDWIYESLPEINLRISTSQISSRNKKRVDVQWKFNYNDYKNQPTLAGFNLYKKEIGKEYVRLNKNRLIVSSTDSIAVISYKDKNLKNTVQYVYALAPVTIFNNEANYFEIEYNPTNVPGEFPQMKLFKDSTSSKVLFSWNFEKTNERFIKGFKILRENEATSSYDSIAFVSPSVRSYEETSPPKSKWYTYNYKVKTELKGNYYGTESNLISFFIPPKPETPKNFNIALNKEGKNYSIILKWEPNKKDTFTTGYYIYTTDRNPVSKIPSLYKSYLPMTFTNQIKYEYVSSGNRYGFAVAAVYNIYGVLIEGEKSNIEYILIPTGQINRLQFENVNQTNDKRVIFNWNFNSKNYPDMKGFRIYNNGQLFMDENKISKESRTITSDVLKPAIYKFQITAITSSGVESEKMPVWPIVIK